MLQQVIALIIILFFVVRLFILKKRGGLPAGEFVFWLIFWILAAISISSLKWLDKLVANLGFSAAGINILVYIAVIVLLYLNFRLRLKVEKMDKDIVRLVRKVALDEEAKTKD